MSAQDWGILNLLKDWGTALIAVVLTFGLAAGISAFLKKFKDKRRWNFLNELAPGVSLLIYPIGLRIALEVAPIASKPARWIENTIYVFFVFAFSNLIRQAAMIAIGWSSLRGPRNSETFQNGFIPILRNAVSLVVFTMGGILVLKYFGYDAMSLITALGVGSLAVGLAAKDTLSNMISGFMLIIDRNLRPGDKINLNGTVGIVDEIGLRSTRLNLRDGNTLIAPNQDLVNSKILNMSMSGSASSCSTRFRVPLHVPFSQVKALCEAIHPEIVHVWKDKGCWTLLSSLESGQQLISFGFWVYNSDQAGNALSDFHVRLLEKMQREGIPLLGDPALSSKLTSL